jgi:uncharacterized membrane protein YqhA
MRRNGRPPQQGDDEAPRVALLAQGIGRSRVVVMIAVIAVMLSAISLFLLGAALAGKHIWLAWRSLFAGDLQATAVTLHFLEVVTVMLKAVFFYLIGVGLYSLFISPLNLTIALGVQTLGDLEAKIISVVIVILAVHFMERFIEDGGAQTVLLSALALAAAVVALVLFQWQAHHAAHQYEEQSGAQLERAKVELFDRSHEEHEIGEPKIEQHTIEERKVAERKRDEPKDRESRR